MIQVLIKGGQSGSMQRCQISQVMVGHLFGFARVRVECWQVVRDSDRLAISGELVEQLPRFLHRRIDRLFVGGDTQKAKFGEWTQKDAFPGKPGKSFGMVRMIRPNRRQENVYVQQMP